MSLTTRAATAAAVLAVAAIPVGALTVSHTSTQPVSIAVDNGEAAHRTPAAGSADVTPDCGTDCAASRLVPDNATLAADSETLVTVAAAPRAESLVPQKPATDPAAAAAPIATGALPEARQEAPPRRAAVRKKAYAQKKGPASGSLEMLFSGPGKK
jgi:hypothetical protein